MKITEKDVVRACETLANLCLRDGVEVFEKNYHNNEGEIQHTVFVFTGPSAPELTAMVREYLDKQTDLRRTR